MIEWKIYTTGFRDPFSKNVMSDIKYNKYIFYYLKNITKYLIKIEFGSKEKKIIINSLSFCK